MLSTEWSENIPDPMKLISRKFFLLFLLPVIRWSCLHTRELITHVLNERRNE